MKPSDPYERISASLKGSRGPVDSSPAYHSGDTPSKPNGGALREGNAPDAFSKELLGLQVQYASSGLVYTVLYMVIYPFLNNYLRMSGIETTSAMVMLSLPYTLKVFFGILSDCYPIFGFRRRPYMVIGWLLCTVCCMAMTMRPTGDPYYHDPTYALVDPTALSPEIVATFNTSAPLTGRSFLWLIVIANLGMVVASTAAGGIMVELSQCEPEHTRGRLQTFIWVSTDVGMIGASSLVGFGLNSADFGGTFKHSIGVSGLMGICAAVSAATTVSSWLNITEVKTSRLSIRKESARLFKFMQMKVVYRVLAFQLFRNMFSNVSVTASLPIRSLWAKVEPVNSSVASTLSFLMSALSLMFVSKHGLNWNWRLIIVICQVAVVLIDCFPTFFTIWDIYRSQWFWLGVPLIEQVPTNFAFIVATFAWWRSLRLGTKPSCTGSWVQLRRSRRLSLESSPKISTQTSTLVWRGYRPMTEMFACRSHMPISASTHFNLRHSSLSCCYHAKRRRLKR